MRVSLRLVLGALSAVTVALVASVTLSITLQSSVSALRRIGEKHADALLAMAEGETTNLFATGSDIVMQLVNTTESRHWANPSESMSTLAFFQGAVLSSFLLGMPDITSLTQIFRDNSNIGADINGPTSTWYSLTTFVPDRPYNVAHSEMNRDVTAYTDIYNRTTHRLSDTLANTTYSASNARVNGFWDQLKLFTLDGTTAVVTPFQAVYRGDGLGGIRLDEFVPMLAPMYTPGESAATGHEPFSLTYVAFSTLSLDDFLQRTRSTAGTVAFAYDGLGFVIATSNPDLPSRELRPVNPTVPEGCASTARWANVGDDNVTHHLVCRHPLTEFPHAGLREIASTDRSLLFPSRATGRSVQRIDAAGEVFYAASVQVPLAFPGQELYLALLVPEADVIGDVITSRNVAIGVTCGLVVIAALVNFAIVFVLLRPLNDVSARMLRAANFDEDEDSEVDVSSMSEVAQLQEACMAMSDELDRIRAYVPQSVLMARKAAQDGDEDDEEEDIVFDAKSGNNEADIDTSHQADSDLRSVSSRRSRKSKNSTGSIGGIAAPASSDVALVTRQVSVVSANLVGLHTMSADRLVDEIASATQVVDEAVSSRRGALTFHGDRFLATFNAAKPCAGHAVKAASAAVAAAAMHAERGNQLRFTAGVASGLCTVGPMGSASVKALSTVGASVAAAALLERLAVHGGHGAQHSVLATQRIASEASASLIVQYVDIVAAPGSGHPLAVASLQHRNGDRRQSVATSAGHATDGAGDDEWMYVMAKQTSPFNAVFEELHRRRVTEAMTMYVDLVRQELETAGSPAALMEEDTASPHAHDNNPSGVPWRLREVMSALETVDASEKQTAEGALMAECRRLEFHRAAHHDSPRDRL